MRMVNFPKAQRPGDVVSEGWIRHDAVNTPYADRAETVVRLVVLDAAFEASAASTPYGCAYTKLDGWLVGQDPRSDPAYPDLTIDDALRRSALDETKRWTPFGPVDEHFPCRDGRPAYFGQTSRPYLAALLLDRDPASYVALADGKPWICRVGDLTEDGRRLFDILTRVYAPAGTVQLQTWLTT